MSGNWPESSAGNHRHDKAQGHLLGGMTSGTGEAEPRSREPRAAPTPTREQRPPRPQAPPRGQTRHTKPVPEDQAQASQRPQGSPPVALVGGHTLQLPWGTRKTSSTPSHDQAGCLCRSPTAQSPVWHAPTSTTATGGRLAVPRAVGSLGQLSEGLDRRTTAQTDTRVQSRGTVCPSQLYCV